MSKAMTVTLQVCLAAMNVAFALMPHNRVAPANWLAAGWCFAYAFEAATRRPR